MIPNEINATGVFEDIVDRLIPAKELDAYEQAIYYFLVQRVSPEELCRSASIHQFAWGQALHDALGNRAQAAVATN